MTFTLVDPPVTPYAPPAERAAWVAECRRRVEENPDDPGWRDALADAERMAAMAADGQP
jgi:hypothetical protein